MDASNIIKPALSRGELQCIGATTLNEYRKYIEKDAALERRFQTVKVEAPSVDETILILKGIRPKYEAHHKARISDEALEAAAKLSDRYLTGRFLPDKAIDVMDEAGSRARIAAMTRPPERKGYRGPDRADPRRQGGGDQGARFREGGGSARQRETGKGPARYDSLRVANQQGREGGLVTEDEIMHVVSKWTGVPLSRMEQQETQKLLAMESELKGKVIGQDEAVIAISKALRRSRADLKDPAGRSDPSSSLADRRGKDVPGADARGVHVR